MLDLVKALEEAARPDRKLDAVLARTFGLWEYHGPEPWQTMAGHWVSDTTEGFGSYDHNTQLCDCRVAYNAEPPLYTHSLDAARTLFERAFPRWELALTDLPIMRDGMRGALAMIGDPAKPNGPSFKSWRNPGDLALALCIAVAKAEAAKRPTQTAPDLGATKA